MHYFQLKLTFLALSPDKLDEALFEMTIISLNKHFTWMDFYLIMGKQIILVRDLLDGKIMLKIVLILELKLKRMINVA